MSTQREVEELAKRVAADPKNRGLLLDWGDACTSAGDNVMAAEAFTRLAVELELNGAPAKAMMFLNDVLELDPSRTDTLPLLIEWNLLYGMRDEAVEYHRQDVTRAGRTTPSGPERELLFATILFQAGDHEDEAREELARAEVLLRAESPVLADAVLRMLAFERGDMDSMSAAMDDLGHRLAALHGLDFKMPN